MRQLYHTPLSPFCRKARMHLWEKGLEFALVCENPWEHQLEYFSATPAGEVPVLVEANGTAVCGNHAIAEYLEEAYGGPSLLGHTPVARAEARRLVDWFDHKFDFEVTQKLLFEKIFKRFLHSGPPDSEAIRRGKEYIHYHLDYIAYLVTDRTYLAGDGLTLADLAAAAHLSALDYIGDVPWDYNARAHEWYGLMKSRPSMRCVLLDRVGGLKPPVYYEDPDF